MLKGIPGKPFCLKSRRAKSLSPGTVLAVYPATPAEVRLPAQVASLASWEGDKVSR